MSGDSRLRVRHLQANAPELAPDEVAMNLCDEDVANGDYEGCSSELELTYAEYESHRSRE